MNKTTITYDHIATRYAARATYPLEQELTRQAGQERFFAYYQPEEIDRLIQAGNFEIVGHRLFRRLRQETHPSGP